MEVIPLIYEVVFVLEGAIDHEATTFDNSKEKINPLNFYLSLLRPLQEVRYIWELLQSDQLLRRWS